ncbi:hypothetical protein C0Q44_13520 [Paenibacillus sp. PCH8]|uniref:hypothetical protein n=1 Tax=Paenibacillus sp. PCH8 TaxID=2066524 RepID=UPI000CF9DB34|nr:hypothetical protein [Paenibacillus sp. PCH8]PQP82457.1 hypothetical protein C0Q44_13520 [Paenibacillus sp. PCH8]
MAVPATTGRLREKLFDMEIGDYIVWKYDNTITGYIFGGSTTGYTEISLTGNPLASMPLKYYWYAVKVNKGLLIADRVVSNTTTWDWLNSNKFVEGSPHIISGTSGVVRCPSGGVAYADASGNKTFENKNKGCFPSNNEWDKYINNFPVGLIKKEKTINDVWNYDRGVQSWTKDTSINGIYTSSTGTKSAQVNSTYRTIRGGDSLFSGVWGGFGIYPSNTSSVDCGYRPIFEYREV